MQESESLFDVVLDQIVPPLERAKPGEGVTMPEPVDPAAEGVTREHSPEVREVLRRAGLSMKSELTDEELARCRRIISDPFVWLNASTDRIRRYIIPPPVFEDDETG